MGRCPLRFTCSREKRSQHHSTIREQIHLAIHHAWTSFTTYTEAGSSSDGTEPPELDCLPVVGFALIASVATIFYEFLIVDRRWWRSRIRLLFNGKTNFTPKGFSGKKSMGFFFLLGGDKERLLILQGVKKSWSKTHDTRENWHSDKLDFGWVYKSRVTFSRERVWGRETIANPRFIFGLYFP